MKSENYLVGSVVVFWLQSPLFFEKTLNSLKNNFLASKTNLYLFIDGPKKQV